MILKQVVGVLVVERVVTSHDPEIAGRSIGGGVSVGEP